MGSTGAKPACYDECNCFTHDTRIKTVDIVRCSTKDWIWSNKHDNALILSLSSFYAVIPKEIMYLIKDHSFHHREEYKILHPIIKREKYYSEQNQLFQKKLCQHWYLTQTNFSTDSVSIGLHVNNSKDSESIFDVMCDATLPSLQLRAPPTKPGYIRTMHVDACKIRLDLMIIGNKCNNKTSKYPLIHMIILHEYDALIKANNLCKMLWNQTNCMKNCIIVKIKDSVQNEASSNCKAIDELAKCYNIPCISICIQNENTITNLFHFAIKNYWFRNVVQ